MRESDSDEGREGSRRRKEGKEGEEREGNTETYVNDYFVVRLKVEPDQRSQRGWG